jgi:hypothetical protein
VEAKIIQGDPLPLARLTTRLAIDLPQKVSYGLNMTVLEWDDVVEWKEGVTELDDVCGCGDCTASASSACDACRSVRYCSRECQMKHWKQHKQECKIFSRKMSYQATATVISTEGQRKPLCRSPEYKGNPGQYARSMNLHYCGPQDKPDARIITMPFWWSQ